MKAPKKTDGGLAALARNHVASGKLSRLTFTRIKDRDASDAKSREDVSVAYEGSPVCCLLGEIDPDKVSEDGMIPDRSHYRAVADHHGYPTAFAFLQDKLVMEAADDDAGPAHVALCAAIDRQADWPRMQHKLFKTALDLVSDRAGDGLDLVKRASALHGRAAAGETITDDEWEDVREDALEFIRDRGDTAERHAVAAALQSSIRASDKLAVASHMAARAIACARDDGAFEPAWREVREAILDAMNG